MQNIKPMLKILGTYEENNKKINKISSKQLKCYGNIKKIIKILRKSWKH